MPGVLYSSIVEARESFRLRDEWLEEAKVAREKEDKKKAKDAGRSPRKVTGGKRRSPRSPRR